MGGKEGEQRGREGGGEKRTRTMAASLQRKGRSDEWVGDTFGSG